MAHCRPPARSQENETSPWSRTARAVAALTPRSAAGANWIEWRPSKPGEWDRPANQEFMFWGVHEMSKPVHDHPVQLTPIYCFSSRQACWWWRTEHRASTIAAPSGTGRFNGGSVGGTVGGTASSTVQWCGAGVRCGRRYARWYAVGSRWHDSRCSSGTVQWYSAVVRCSGTVVRVVRWGG